MNESFSEWMQLYQQTIDTCFEFSDAPAVTDSSCATCSSSFLAADHLNPKGSISKPIRRRSRVSKRAPTTLLKADAKNFRSLVQQFTGFRRRSTSISFGNPRGAVDINFALGKELDYHTTTDHASISQPFVGSNNCCGGQSQLQQQEEHQQQQCQRMSVEEQECQFSFDSITADEFLLASSCFPRSGSQIQIPQGLAMDDLYFSP